MQYFYLNSAGAQEGPMTLEQLKKENITPQTLVWHDGMPEWMPAAKLPELSQLFAATAPTVIITQPTSPARPVPVNHVPATGNSKNNRSMIIACIVGGILLVAATVFAVLYFTGKDDKTPTAVAETSADEEPQAPEPDDDVKTFTVNNVSFKMIKVKGGSFTMGATSEQRGADADEYPLQPVTLDDYYIGQTEVTQELWEAVMGYNYSRFKGANLPADRISWDDCQLFLSKLNELTGQNFALPTEAQWEYAARGGNKSAGYQYSGSNNIDEVAWYGGNSGSRCHPVASKKPNELGLYDMTGNVWEWCSDYYGPYSSEPVINPQGVGGSKFVNRGGCWRNDGKINRIANRDCNFSTFSGNFGIGLRLCL